MKKKTKYLNRIILTFTTTSLMVILVSAFLIRENIFHEETQKWLNLYKMRTQLFCTHFNEHLNYAVSDLEFIAGFDEFATLPYINKIDTALHGIPENLDTTKRQIFTKLITKNNSFNVLFLLIPNGNHYISHPYEIQRKLKKFNLSDRSYFQKAKQTKKTVISESFIGADGEPAIAIDVPLLDKNKEIYAHLAGVFYLSKLSDFLSQGRNSLIEHRFIVDNNGCIVAHTDSIMLAPENRILNKNTTETSELYQHIKNIDSETEVFSGELSNTKHKYLFTAKKLENGWTVCVYVPYSLYIKNAETRFWWSLIIVLIIFISICSIGAYIILQTGKKWQIAENKVVETNEKLENLVKQRTEELQYANQNLTNRIFEKRKVLSVLESERKQFSDLVNSIEGIVWELDIATSKFVFVSDKIKKILGYEPDFWLNDFSNWAKVIHPEDREWAINYCEQEAGACRNHTFEYRIISANNEVVWLRDIVTVITENNAPVKMRGVMFDITEIKNNQIQLIAANEAIAQSARQWQTTFDAISDIICVITKDKEIIQINKSANEEFHLSSSEIIGRKCEDVFKSSVCKTANCPCAIISQTKKEVDSEMEFDDKIFFRSTWPIFDAQKEIISYIHIFKDVTEKKNSEKELIKAKERAEESDRLKSAFLANMSHEVRTPLNAIVGFSQLLASNIGSPDKRNKFVRIIQERSNDLLKLVEDIIEISKIESGTALVSNSDFDIDYFMCELNEIFYSQLIYNDGFQKKLKLNINNTIPLEQRIILTDTDKITAILNHLINNAIKFTEEGEITVSCFLNNNDIVFSVADTGVGISKQDQEVIFKPFRQLEESLTRKFGGTGLGLAIVKGYLDLLNGKIWVDSEPGKGAEFSFCIPFVLRENTKENGDYSNEPDLENWNNKKILIVEDDEYNADFLLELLSGYNLNVILATNGVNALNLYTTHNPFDLILMDIRLPDISGYELTKTLREMGCSSPIIAQTAFTKTDEAQKNLHFGCNDHISKPIGKNKLFAIMNKYFYK